MNDVMGEHTFAKDKNEITTAFNFERHVFPSPVQIKIEAFELDAPLDKGLVYGSGGLHTLPDWCGIAPE